MTTNPYENKFSPVTLPGYMPVSVEGDYLAVEPTMTETAGSESQSVVGNEFFRIPEIAPANIDEIDTTGWSEDAKAALARLDGRGRREQQNDAMMRLTAQVVSDVYGEHLAQRESRLSAQSWSIYSITEAENSRNQAAMEAKVAAQRRERAQQEKLDIDDDIYGYTDEIRHINIERKARTAERDELQQQFDALTDRAHELAQLMPKPGEAIVPLVEEERERYITETAVLGTLMGIEPGPFEEGSVVERLRAAAVIEQLYLPHYAAKLTEIRTQIRELTEQIRVVEEQRRLKEASKNLIQERLIQHHLSSTRSDTILESRKQDVEEQIAMADRIPEVPEEDFLDQARRERDIRLGRLLETGLPNLPQPTNPGVAAGKPAVQLSVGGSVRPQVRVHMTLPVRKDQ